MVDYNKLPREDGIYVNLPIKYIDFHVPKEGLTHKTKLKIPYHKNLFDYYSDCFKSRQTISIWNYASEGWTDLEIKGIEANDKEIILKLKEEY